MRDEIALLSRNLDAGAPSSVASAVRQFTQLSKDAGRLSNLAVSQTDRELKQLQKETGQARRRLYWQALALVPVTLTLIVVFAAFLARPINQIDAAISNIGHGRLSEPVAVRGPSNLEALGRQLEWLRVRLTEITEERNRFLRHMSHELKTPLANIGKAPNCCWRAPSARWGPSSAKWRASCATTGFGGSMIWFGSSACVAISNMYPEAKSVGAWLKHGWFVTVAYVVGFLVMLALWGWHPTEKRASPIATNVEAVHCNAANALHIMRWTVKS